MGCGSSKKKDPAAAAAAEESVVPELPPEPQPWELKFDELDTNKNGLIEGSELSALAAWSWATLRERDEGPLDNPELVAAEGRKILALNDKNHDGALSRDEFSAYYSKTIADRDDHLRAIARTAKPALMQFERLDVDHSAQIDGDELLALASWVWRASNGGKEPSDAEIAAEAANIKQLVDTNNDGVIDASEFIAYYGDRIVLTGERKKGKMTVDFGLAPEPAKPKASYMSSVTASVGEPIMLMCCDAPSATPPGGAPV